MGGTGGGIVVGKGVVVGTAFTGLVVVDPKRERISTLVASRATGNPPFQRVNVGTLGFGFTVMKLKPAGRVPVSLVNSQTLVRGVVATLEQTWGQFAYIQPNPLNPLSG